MNRPLQGALVGFGFIAEKGHVPAYLAAPKAFEIVAFIVPANERSARVCARLGMNRDPADDFEHPLFAAGARTVVGGALRHHHLYRLRSGRGQMPRDEMVEPSTS